MSWRTGALGYAIRQFMQDCRLPSTGFALPVEAALARAAALLRRMMPIDFPNGAVVFCSDVDIAEALHPPRPLQQMFACDTRFHTAAIREALDGQRQRTYGILVVDGDEATLGIAEAPPGPGLHARASVIKVAHLDANIASRTRRGGQSATRYARNRDREELSFLRKVAERSVEAFGDVVGIIVGGRADMKRKLLPELPQALRTRVVCVTELSCSADSEGLQKAAARTGEVAEMGRQLQSKGAVQRFLEEVSLTDAHAMPTVCYGASQTTAALRLGAVEKLLLAASVADQGSWETWTELAAASRASVTRVDPQSTDEVQFCQGFVIGGVLRYALDPALLEEQAADEEEVSRESLAPVLDDFAESSCVSTAVPESDDLLLEWLSTTLERTFKDVALAESLTACADVVLSDDTTPAEERLESTVEMLRDQGVPEEVLNELTCHILDRFDGEEH